MLNNLEYGTEGTHFPDFASIRRVIFRPCRSFEGLDCIICTFAVGRWIKVLKKNKLIYICGHFARFFIQLKNNIQN